MRRVERVDFAVVGAGIAGASAAFELSLHGSVQVLEAEATPGYHTTGRSAAMFTEAYESGIVRRLTMASRPFLEQPPEGFTDHPLLSPRPVLFVGRDDQREAVEALARDIAAWGPEIQVLEGDQIPDVCPVLRPDYASLALFEPGSYELDVHGLHQGFLRGARSRGARIRTGALVSGLRRLGSGWWIQTGSEEIHAAVVVNAAGAWCDVVGGLAGARPLGIQPMRRTAFTFPCPEGIDCRTLPFVDDVGEQWYFKPEGAGLLGSLSEETPMEPHDVRHEERDVALAIERIGRAVTFPIRHVGKAWAGLSHRGGAGRTD